MMRSFDLLLSRGAGTSIRRKNPWEQKVRD